MTDTPNPLHDSAFMQAFFDLVIPPSKDGKRPGAGSLGLATDLANTLAKDDRSSPVVAAGLLAVREAATTRDPGGFTSLSPQARRETVETVLAGHPRLILGVARHLYLIYYQHPQVLAAIGEPPRPPFPEGYDVQPTDPDLLQALEARRQGQ